MQNLLDLLTELDSQIKNLNKSLTHDKDLFLNYSHDAVEQSHIDKLTIKNGIDALINQLKDQTEWLELLKNNFSQGQQTSDNHLYKECASLWQSINGELIKNIDLIQVNQLVVDNNKAYFDHVIKCLSNINSSTDNIVYTNQAKIDPLK